MRDLCVCINPICYFESQVTDRGHEIHRGQGGLECATEITLAMKGYQRTLLTSTGNLEFYMQPIRSNLNWVVVFC